MMEFLRSSFRFAGGRGATDGSAGCGCLYRIWAEDPGWNMGRSIWTRESGPGRGRRRAGSWSGRPRASQALMSPNTISPRRRPPSLPTLHRCSLSLSTTTATPAARTLLAPPPTAARAQDRPYSPPPRRFISLPARLGQRATGTLPIAAHSSVLSTRPAPRPRPTTVHTPAPVSA